MCEEKLDATHFGFGQEFGTKKAILAVKYSPTKMLRSKETNVRVLASSTTN